MAQTIFRINPCKMIQTMPQLLFGSGSLWPSQRTASRGSALYRRRAATETSSQAQSIYDQPQLYDDAFSYRDFQAEVKFLLGAYQQHAPSSGNLQTALELGCGPANHAVQLAKCKVESWALDANAGMLEFATRKAADARVHITTALADMARFEVQGMQGKFDMILCMLGTLSHMLDNKQASACFAQVSKHLRPGGLFVLELAHPGDLFDGSLLLQDTGAEMWEVDKPDHKMMVVWGSDADVFDPETQVLYRTVSIHTMKDGDMDKCLLEEVVSYRQFTTQEVDLLAMMHGLEVVGVYGDLDLGVSLRHEDAFRLVMILRKK